MPEVLNRHDDFVQGAVYIGRGSKWGNPFVMSIHGDRDEVCDLYEEWLLGHIPAPEGVLRPSLEDAKAELKGKNLSCYCAPRRCHGDYLLKVANASN